VLGAVVVIVAGGAGLGYVGWLGGLQPAAAAEARPTATATATRQTLVDTAQVRGTLGFGSPTRVADRLGGTLTWLPVPGAAVRRGEVLFRVDERPVVLVHGAVPAYREMSAGMQGSDVRQLEENLRALGYTGFDVDDRFTATTTTAVRRWQQALGVERTGAIAWGQVVFASGDVRVAGAGGGVGEDAAVSVTGTERVVTVSLDVERRDLAPVGGAVELVLPDGSSLGGTVAAATTVVESSEGSGGGEGRGGEGAEETTRVQVVITPADQRRLAEYDRASVEVTFAAERRDDVLTVPVEALLALAEGGYGVEVVGAAGGTRVVAVETGLFAKGLVEVSGGDLTDGASVVVPS